MATEKFTQGIILHDYPAGSVFIEQQIVQIKHLDKDPISMKEHAIVEHGALRYSLRIGQDISLDLDHFKKIPPKPDKTTPAKPGMDLFADQRVKQKEQGGGMRFNEGKVPLQYNLLGSKSAELEAEVWAVGAVKYDPGNWLKGQSVMGAAGSVLRHLAALLNPFVSDYDEESGLHHGGHLICSVKIFVESIFAADGKYDDRPQALMEKKNV